MKRMISLLVLVFSMTMLTAYADNEDVSTENKLNAETEQNYIIYAVQSPYACINGVIENKWDRPYVYNEKTYIPVRNTTECLGGEVLYDGDNGIITVKYKNNNYSLSVNDERIRINDGVSFIPLREMCNYLGVTVNWYDGIITLSDDGYYLTDDGVEKYKEELQYEGYYDEYFTPRTVVNPYVTYSYEQMNEDVIMLSKMYPDLIYDVHSIGKSTEGRDITAFRMGNGDKTIVMCGSMHAREHIATNFLMYMVDSYASGYVNNEMRGPYNVREILDNFSFLIVPMVNPDGINIVQNGFESSLNEENLKEMPVNSFGHRGWKATSLGVDLNNNFDFLWRAKNDSPASAGYAGPYAASEPETRAMQNLIDTTDFALFASFHTQGQVVYWMDPNCDQSLYDKFSPYVDRICWEIGFEKMPSDGEIGYSGYMTDYIRYSKKAMALTIELCPYVGDYPYPESDFDTVAYPVRNIGFILADVAQYL